MSSSRRPLLLLATVALLAGACGGSPAVEVEAQTASVSDAVPVERQVDRVSGPRRTADRIGAGTEDTTTAEQTTAPAPEPEPAAPPAPPEPAPAPTPPAPPAPDGPDLVVGEDGCVTDRDLGIVIACHDPAAGPD